MELPDIIIQRHDGVFMKILCDRNSAILIQKQFEFFIDNHKFHPKVKAKVWDGKIKLFNLNTRLIYSGILPYVIEFCKEKNWSYSIDPVYDTHNYNDDIIEKFIEYIKLPEDIEPRDWQLEGLKIAINDQRGLLLAATGTGKSLLVYMIIRWILGKTKGKILFVGSRKFLMSQIQRDIKSYGYHDDIHTIYDGAVHETDSRIIASTYQSIINNDPKWFEQFDAIIGDEVHEFTAASLKKISEMCINTKFRFGLTGSLEDTKTHKLVLSGLFGPIHDLISTAEGIELGILSQCMIKVIILQHDEQIRKLARKSKLKYEDELAYIISHEKRNNFIVNLALSLAGNTIIFFNEKEHGKRLVELLKRKTNAPVHYIDGDISNQDRIKIFESIDKSELSYIVASGGTTSTGVNAVNLNNLIFARPYRKKSRVKQAVGRILRNSKNMDLSTVYDIGDDMCIGVYKNHTYNQLLYRLEVYNDEKHNVKIYKHNI